jgi:hypothetical protein
MNRPRYCDDERNEDARRDDIDARRERFNGCKCGNPDMPGYCPGWRSCPLCAETTEPEVTE